MSQPQTPRPARYDHDAACPTSRAKYPATDTPTPGVGGALSTRASAAARPQAPWTDQKHGEYDLHMGHWVIKLGDDLAIGHNTSAPETRTAPTAPRPLRRTPRAPTTAPGAARQDAIALAHDN